MGEAEQFDVEAWKKRFRALEEEAVLMAAELGIPAEQVRELIIEYLATIDPEGLARARSVLGEYWPETSRSNGDAADEVDRLTRKVDQRWPNETVFDPASGEYRASIPRLGLAARGQTAAAARAALDEAAWERLKNQLEAPAVQPAVSSEGSVQADSRVPVT
ncbi:MAG TPA: hypothetical protein VK963_01910 [Candidatus Saccharimonadales bacterium]|nr:hypothetical protein [Candidatus Saccharimonadales bacterium]